MQHNLCPHPATPGARDACRMLNRLLVSARRRDLEIVWCGCDKDHPMVWQVWIKNPRRALDTKLLVTCSRGVPTVSVCHLTSTEKVAFRRAFTWLEIIAI